MTGKTQPLSFKKSVLSLVIISSITGGLIALQKYRMGEELLAPSESRTTDTLSESTMADTDAKTADVVIPAEVLPADEKQNEPGISQAQGEDENPTVDATEQKEVEVKNQQTVVELPTSEKKQDAIKEEVFFGLDSSVIAPSYYPLLTKTAELIKAAGSDNKIVWQVVGYADPSGTAQYNSRLAQKRAQAVAEFLVAKGVDKTQLAVLSLGDSRVGKMPTEKAKLHLQRRVEIHLLQADIARSAEQLNNAQQGHKQLPAETSQESENKLSQQKNAQDKLSVSSSQMVLPLSFAMQL